VSNVFGISITALQAFQQAINVAANNVANASTPGYSKETINLTEAIPQANGAATVGAGVSIAGISRAFNQTATNQLNTAQANLGQLDAMQNYSSQIDNLFGTTIGGLSNTLQGFYSAWSDVANNPTSSASRQALLSAAQSVAGSFQSASSELQNLNTDVNSRIGQDVTQINSIATAISTLNSQIQVGIAKDGANPPNELLDQRDTLVTNLSKLVGVSTTTEADGAMNVFIGNGQPLVLEGQTTKLTTVPNQFIASQLEISTSSTSATISANITSGDLGGLLAARTQIINPALAQLGQVATGLSQTVNAQQAQGLDLNGNLGTALFGASVPTAVSSSKNTDAVTAAAGLSDISTLGTDNFVVTYKAGTYSVTKASDGSAIPFTGTGTAANPIVVNGVSVVLSAPPANGDQFLIQPAANAAAGLKAILTDPSKVAAAGAVKGTAAATNTGSATLSAPTVLNAANANLLTPATITFSNPTTYSINGGAAQAYTPGGNIDFNGWEVQIAGTPAAGDSFAVGSNAGGTGDNRNALASAALQTKGVFSGGTISISSAVSSLITGIGSQTQQINTAQTAQSAVATQAQAAVQSATGVNLDEEAASLLQWQQAYQAAAQALSIGNSLFSSLLNAVNGR
jgi:flagellar hook-associated protein 1